MSDQFQLYFAILQRYFGIGIATFVALQPLLILLTSAAHAIEVQGRSRGWAKVQACGYWVAKVAGTFAAVDMRNVQRVTGKVFVILAQVLDTWASKEAKTKAVTRAMDDAGRMLCLALALGAVASGCAGTLEDSRGRISPALTLPRTVEVSKRCQSLSDQNKWFKVGAATSGVLAGSSGLTAWPVQDGDVERALFISAGVLGVAATGLTLLQAETASQYVAEGCAK